MINEWMQTEVYGVFVFSSVVILYLWVMLKPHDMWPFTCYPMFSVRIQPNGMLIYRIALEHNSGGETWWNPDEPRHQKRLAILLASADSGMRPDRYQQKYQFLNAAMCCVFEQPSNSTAMAFRVYRQTPIEVDNSLRTNSELVERITFAEIKAKYHKNDHAEAKKSTIDSLAKEYDDF